jgi:hypothetical protein
MANHLVSELRPSYQRSSSAAGIQKRSVMKSGWLSVVAVAATLSACGDPAQQLATAKPATGPALARYANNATDMVSLGSNGDLVQRFCVNQSGKACADDIADELKKVGFLGEGPANELGDAFARIEADRIDGTPDQKSSDEVYVTALYHIALGREPEAGGATGHINAIKGGLGRPGLVRAFMESLEFKSLT